MNDKEKETIRDIKDAADLYIKLNKDEDSVYCLEDPIPSFEYISRYCGRILKEGES